MIGKIAGGVGDELKKWMNESGTRSVMCGFCLTGRRVVYCQPQEACGGELGTGYAWSMQRWLPHHSPTFLEAAHVHTAHHSHATEALHGHDVVI